jgi:hypothetical protein
MATPRKTPEKTAPEPGTKPEYFVIEDHLKCQTNEGEISIDLRIPLKRLELLMDMDEIEQKKIPRHLLDNILNPADKATIEGMRDGAKAFKILIKVTEVLGERMGADLGESTGSTESSANTVEPSATTSDTASE